MINLDNMEYVKSIAFVKFTQKEWKYIVSDTIVLEFNANLLDFVNMYLTDNGYKLEGLHPNFAFCENTLIIFVEKK